MSQAAPAKKSAAKPRKATSHPPYAEMIAAAIVGIGEKRGASKVAIKKYILSKFKLEDTKSTNTRINMTLKRGVNGGQLVTARGHTGTFKAAKAEGAKKSVDKTPKKAAAAKKPAAVKKTPKKPSAKKAMKKTPAKKSAAKKTPKKPKTAAKKPSKKSSKKTPVRKPVAKKPAKK